MCVCNSLGFMMVDFRRYLRKNQWIISAHLYSGFLFSDLNWPENVHTYDTILHNKYEWNDLANMDKKVRTKSFSQKKI